MRSICLINDCFYRSLDGSLSICHLAELDGETLYLYGPGSLDALDRNWGTQAVNSVSLLFIKFIDFDAIVPYFHKICARFPALVVCVTCCSASSFALYLFHWFSLSLSFTSFPLY